MSETQTGYAFYVKTWLALLVVTVVMIGAEMLHLPRTITVVMLVAFMLIKAGMIGGNFMHLKSENRAMQWLVILGLLVLGGVMFGLMAVDGLRVGELSPLR